MPVAAITKQGLASIAVLVALLWVCVFAERTIIGRAKLETYRSLRDIRYLRLKRTVEPASNPRPVLTPHSVRPAVG